MSDSNLYTTIRGSVRSTDASNAKVAHLHEQFPKLQLVAADLTKAEGWDEAVKGCAVVYHTASPFQTQVKTAGCGINSATHDMRIYIRHAHVRDTDRVHCSSCHVDPPPCVRLPMLNAI